jgi:hypothetical protein
MKITRKTLGNIRSNLEMLTANLAEADRRADQLRTAGGSEPFDDDELATHLALIRTNLAKMAGGIPDDTNVPPDQIAARKRLAAAAAGMDPNQFWIGATGILADKLNNTQHLSAADIPRDSVGRPVGEDGKPLLPYQIVERNRRAEFLKVM